MKAEEVNKLNEAKKLKIEEVKIELSKAELDEAIARPHENSVIGQKRAIEAIKMGINIEEDGYNILVIGESGTGRRTAVFSLLEHFKPKKESLQDIAYAFNFTHSLQPILLYFPPAKGMEFKLELRKAIKKIRTKVRAMVKTGILFHENNKIKEKIEVEEVNSIANFELMLKENGFETIEKKDGNDVPTIFPLIKGKPISFLDLEKMELTGKISKEEYKAIKEKYYSILDEFHIFLKHLNDIERDIKRKTQKKQNEALKPIIKKELKNILKLVESYDSLLFTEKQKEDNQNLKNYVKQVEKDLCKRLSSLVSPFKNHKRYVDFISRYEINVIYKNDKNKKYVIDEPITHFADLFGTITLDPESGKQPKNGHLKIKEGAIHRALNGYIILRLDAILKEEDAWEYLKNMLLSKKVKIPSMIRSAHSSFILNPQAIEKVPKVIMIGDEELYNILLEEEKDFYKLFKVVAQFDSTMIRNDENEKEFVNLISNLQQKQKLLPLKNSAYKRLIIYSSAMADSSLHLSTQFTKIADCLTEANYIAKQLRQEFISEQEITSAIEKKRYFYSLAEEKYFEMLKIKDLIIEVKNKTASRVNGLAIEEVLGYSFGVPIAITAQVSCGMGGVINIEKEVGLSGEIFDKAHLIITSLLRKKFLKHYPLCISASICSEQSYSFIDGDSASCAHFLALISAIGEIEMRQDIAITGSLNQLGEVQAVGGINEKVTGFFNTCKILGFTGKGGVVIPESNKTNLFLNDEILDAIKKGYFNIWTIKTIDEAITLLTDLPESTYTPIIEERLNSFAKTIIEMHLM